MKHFKLILTLLFLILTSTIFNSILAQSEMPNELWCMEFIDDQTGITLGESGTIRYTNNGGLNWVSKVSGTVNTLKKTAILLDDEIVAVGLSGTIIKTTDQGDTWSTKQSGTSADLYSISFGGRNNEVGIAIGLSGTIIRSTDQGESWSQLISDVNLKNNNYRAVSFASENKGIIVGDNGIILISDDGGLSWRLSSAALPPVNYKFTIMLTEDIAYATGENGTIIKTTDGGETWISVNTGVTNTLYRIRFADDQIAISVGTDGSVLKTTDGGTTWNTESSGTSNNLNCLFVVDDNIAYTGGEAGIILKTTDGGLSWVSQGDTRYSDIHKDNAGIISNYPNPSNPVTTVKYVVPEMSYVSIEVFDVTGKLVKTLVDEPKSEGSYTVQFNGAGLASGTYFCKFVTVNTIGISAKTLRIVLVK